MRVTIVGIGGVGSRLAEFVAQFLWWQKAGHTLTLVDGDVFEEQNHERQAFDRCGKKPEVVARKLAERYPGLAIEAVAEYLTPENAEFILLEGEIVLVAVDNHRTRKLISDIAATRYEISILSGGNEWVTGNVFAYLRRGGRDATPSLTQDHPEIAEPTDRAPFELGCEERARAGEPQLFPTNVMVAAWMFAGLWRLVSDPEGFISRVKGDGVFAQETAWTEVHFDIERARAVSRRIPVKATGQEPETEGATAAPEREEERHEAVS